MSQREDRIRWAKDIAANMEAIPDKRYHYQIPADGSLSIGLGGAKHPMGYSIRPLRPESGATIDISSEDYLVITLAMDRYSGLRFSNMLTMYIDWSSIFFLTFG